MAYDEDLAERVRVVMASRRGVTEQKMFGGIAFMLDGKMAVGVNEDSLLVRVPAEEHARAIKEAGARTMDFTNRPMKGFLFIDPPGTKGASLKKWVERSATYVDTLPAKKKRSVKKKAGKGNSR